MPAEVNDHSLIDLPGLQRRLDALRAGERLTIAITDFRRLFGANGIAQERLSHFAKGHACVVEPAPSWITFRKASTAAT